MCKRKWLRLSRLTNFQGLLKRLYSVLPSIFQKPLAVTRAFQESITYNKVLPGAPILSGFFDLLTSVLFCSKIINLMAFSTRRRDRYGFILSAKTFQELKKTKELFTLKWPPCKKSRNLFSEDSCFISLIKFVSTKFEIKLGN